tara:strand:- start:194 stop:1717 length:1524 start_codon:yes stop_codon:yes gene_type:complete
MKKMNLDDITKYIEEDNKSSLELFNGLSEILDESYAIFPKENNLIGIFFIDLLKLYSSTYLKLKEIDYALVPKEIITSRLRSWPYVGYQQLADFKKYNYDYFGKDTSINFGKKSYDKKTLYINFFRMLKISSKHKKNISIAGQSALTTKKHLDVLLGRSHLSSIKVTHPWFYVKNCDDQISYFRKHLADLLIKYFNEELALELTNLSLKHIIGSININDEEKSIGIDHLQDSEFLILGSGLELHNRMIASEAMSRDIPIINVMHGAAFGVNDEPIFGSYGEQMYSSKILGYGKGILKHAKSYNFITNHEADYIPSNADNISKIFKGKQVSNPSKKDLQYYYFPTSLRGTEHRYGPFADLPDYLYLEWQRILNQIFEGNLKTKTHPKEKYAFLYDYVDSKIVSGSFLEVEDSVDIFIFDYVSTIFHEACATRKPVVFFDLGIRNINDKAMEAIKKRTIYYDLRKTTVPSYAEINERIFEERKENELTETYSLNDKKILRSESLIDALY